jgi:hypothetical protein
MEKTHETINSNNETVGAGLTPVEKIIPESNIVVFSPHYDDVLFMLGGYVTELAANHQLQHKHFHINLLFSRSNYLARTGQGNFMRDLDRIKLATGKRLLEDQECLDELLGKYNYRYELLGEPECFVRGKQQLSESDMEFPHGMYDNFDDNDRAVFARIMNRVRYWAAQKDTALVFPIAFKEHIDHFITREAAIDVAKELGDKAQASFYFQEDKPYGGIADDTEQERVANFIKEHALEARTFEYDPELMITLAFRHYVSQVEEVYKTGIRNRSKWLQEQMQSARPCDRIYKFPQTHSYAAP